MGKASVNISSSAMRSEYNNIFDIEAEGGVRGKKVKYKEKVDKISRDL